MRKTLCIALFLSTSLCAWSQSSSDVQRPFKKDNFLVDLYFTQLMGLNNAVDYKFISHGNAFSFLYDFDLKSKRTSVAVGLGYANQNYYTNGSVTRLDTTVGTHSVFQPLPAGTSYETNKFKTNFLTVPFEVRLRSKADEKQHHWKLYMGGYLKFTMNAFEKYNASGIKIKDLYQPDVRKFGYGVSLRAGYARFMLMTKYSLSPVFQDNKGEVVNNLSIGLTLIPF